MLHIYIYIYIYDISRLRIKQQTSNCNSCLKKFLLTLNLDYKYLPILTLAHIIHYSKFCTRSTSSFKKLPMFRILNELEAKSYIPPFVLSLSTLRSCIASFSTHICLQVQVQAGKNCTITGTYEVFMTVVQYPLQQAFSLLSVVSPIFNNNLT